MLNLILLPVRLVFSIVSAAFHLVGSVIGIVFSVLGGVLGLIVTLGAVLLIPVFIYFIWKLVH